MIHEHARIGEKTLIYFPELSNIGECSIGTKSVIHSHVWIANGVFIGNNVRIQAFTFIPQGVTIEDDVFIGPRVTFLNDKYPPSGKWSTTLIKRGASIGGGAVILPGLSIGENAMVGAGSVVTKHIPDNEVWMGTPAKFFKKKSI